VRITSNYGKISPKDFPKRRDEYEKTVFNHIDGYYSVSNGVYSGMYRRYYKHNKHFICNINCYYDSDVEPIAKSESDDNANDNAN